MRAIRLTVLSAIALTLTGCGSKGDPKPFLHSMSVIEEAQGQIVAALGEGDLKAVDGVLHNSEFKQSLKDLNGLAEESGMPKANLEVIRDANSKLLDALTALHHPLHKAGATIEDFDVPALTQQITTAYSELAGALPKDWVIPKHSHEHAGHDDHGDHGDHGDHDGQDDHAGHDHDGDGHADHADGDHADEAGEAGEEHADHDGEGAEEGHADHGEDK